MKFWAGVTNNAWFQFLTRERIDEVNFWQPRGLAVYNELQSGSLFLFKLRRPYNHIAGGAYFVKSSALPLSLAWEAFGIKNGAASRSDFESMLRSLVGGGGNTDPVVGCTVLAEPFFWPQDQWIADPEDWGANIVRGRYYDTDVPVGRRLWDAVQTRQQLRQVSEEPIGRFGEPILIRPRLGQGAFRVLVTDAYERRCAITGESTLPVLEAAHILPFAENGPHDVSNGLLLRSDFHKLFDAGLVTINDDLRVEVSPRIRDEWSNGKAYYRLHGQKLASLPKVPANHPRPSFLRWHNEKRFRA